MILTMSCAAVNLILDFLQCMAMYAKIRNVQTLNKRSIIGRSSKRKSGW